MAVIGHAALLGADRDQRATGALTWWDTGGYGGGRQLTLAFGRHPGHLDGVGGESGESGNPVLQGDVGQVVGDSGVRAVVLLPRNAITCRDGRETVASGKIRQQLNYSSDSARVLRGQAGRNIKLTSSKIEYSKLNLL